MRTRRRLETVVIVLLLGFLIPAGYRLLQPNPTESHTSPNAISPRPTAPMPAPTPAHPTGSQAPRLTPDLEHWPVLSEEQAPVPGKPGLIKRIRVVRTDFKYPLWRVDDTLDIAPSGGQGRVRSRTIMVADHALVRLHSPANASQLLRFAGRLGLTLRKAMHAPGCYLVSIADESTQALPRLLAMLNRETGLIRYAEPDYVVHTQQTVPNDPSFSALWGLRNIGKPGADIAATQAWDLTTGDTQVVVAVIDTGILYTHPDLASNIWSNAGEALNGSDDDGNGYVDDLRGWNFVADNNDPLDDYGHGTHCAGTIGALGNNLRGVAGVNWNCHILPLKFLNANGDGTDSDATDAFFYLVGLRQRGVNVRLASNSWGGSGYSTALRDAIRAAAEQDILCLMAAGNNGWNNDEYEFYPANYGESNMIVVAATDSNDGLANFSDYGAHSVHLGAPGVTILSTILSTNLDGDYGYMSGTSMATPHVAGAATLLWNTWPSARAQDIRDAILRSTDPVAALSGTTTTGGRLNAFKALKALFRIRHTPLENTYNHGTGYPVEADIGPSLFVDTNAITVFWNADESTTYASLAMERVSNTLYRTTLPEQPEGTIIRYWIRVSATHASDITAPTNAPDSIYAFQIFPPLSLDISGTPEAMGTVTPPYGHLTFPSSQVYQATAPAALPATNGARWACAGWTGTGSIPASGTNSSFSFTLTTNSTLTWQWQHEYALTHTNAVIATLNRTTWWPDAHAATSLTAPASLTVGGTNFMFTGWELDGLRQPDDDHPAVNPVTNIPMSQPRVARATFLPAHLDRNSNAIQDWWEQFYFGTNAVDPAIDSDGDGFSNLDEFLDGTNPRDPDSFPTPPVIVHDPLANPQPHPAPFVVRAVITDNYKVASATLHWNRNGGVPSSRAMPLTSGALYQALLPPPGTNTDVFTYWIVASDASRSTTNGPYGFSPSYPILTPAPAFCTILTRPDTSTNLSLTLTNSGTSPAEVEFHLTDSGLSNAFESSEAPWPHSGTNDLWTLSTNRSSSGSTAWYCGDPATRVYSSNMKARLDTPPLFLDRGAQLTFNHWIQCERDGQWWRPGWLPNMYWDGGMVELSTNGGAAFFALTPQGGYPAVISGYSASPWPDRTPCFGGAGVWSQATFDLSAFTNQVAIIRFEFGSDEYLEEEGWYIDDVIVTPMVPASNWVTLVSSNITVPPLSTLTAPDLLLNATTIPTGNRATAIRITSTDPQTPFVAVPVHLLVRSPPTLSWVAQPCPSTDGSGQVTLSHALHDIDGDSCLLETQWSADAGECWSNLWLNGVTDGQGTALFNNAAIPSITNLVTQSGPGLLLTNVIITGWDTHHAGSGPEYSPSTLVRARACDPFFRGDWVTSQPFMVDNECPPAPASLLSPNHSVSTWSLNPVVSLSWDEARELRGSGVTNYVYGLSTNPPTLIPQGTNDALTASLGPLPDGAQYWAWVCSRDGFGNLSTPTFLGPYGIDTTPPSPSGASLHVAVSPFGNYLIGAQAVTGCWSGFTDAGSGIAGYYYASSNAGGSDQGIWTTHLTGMMSGLAMDMTNSFYVWARDQAGGLSPAISASFLALSPDGDWDHDGVSNRKEEIAGTDAANTASKLFMELKAGQPEFLLQWQGITNRYYTIYYHDRLDETPDWPVLPGADNLEGMEGLMTCTDRTATVPSRFYRISVTAP